MVRRILPRRGPWHSRNHVPHFTGKIFLFQIVDVILKSGQELGAEEKLDVPLMFQWHNKFYLGGAHGVAGILYLLLQVKERLEGSKIFLRAKKILKFKQWLHRPFQFWPKKICVD